MSGMTYKKAGIQIIFFYAVLFTCLALYDEKPCPELAKDMNNPPREIVEPGNAWIAFLGIRAPKGVSPYKHGEEKMLKIREALIAGTKVEETLEEVNEDESGLEFEGKIPKYDRYNSDEYCGITTYVAEHKDQLSDLIERNKEMIARYESLHSYPRYNDPVDYGNCAPVPWFGYVKYGARAKVWRYAMDANNGDIETALSNAAKEIEFWRFMARSSDTLLSKMVAIAVLRMDMRFVGDVAVCHSLNPGELENVLYLFRPFEQGEDRLVEALKGERHYIRRSADCIFGLMKNHSWLPISMLYKPNATGNRIYEYLSDSFNLAKMSTVDFSEEIRKRKDGSGRASRGIGVPFLYNPLGELLSYQASELAGVMQAYISTTHDMEGLRRLQLLRIYAKIRGVTKDQAVDFLEENKDLFGNPYTGKAMEWDPEGFFFYKYNNLLRGKVKAPVD